MTFAALTLEIVQTCSYLHYFFRLVLFDHRSLEKAGRRSWAHPPAQASTHASCSDPFIAGNERLALIMYQSEYSTVLMKTSDFLVISLD